MGVSTTSASSTSARPRFRRWRIAGLVLLVLAVGVALAAWVVLSQPGFGSRASGAELASVLASPHRGADGFVNALPPAPYRAVDVWTLLRGQVFGEEHRVPPAPLPVVLVDEIALTSPPAPGSLQAFWIGHAGAYIAIDGVRLMIDPMFSEYASPLELGPRRFHPPPIALDALPPIDAVLITHDHYDHLDMRTAQHLARRGALFMVPLGIGAHLRAWGVAAGQIREFDWWQEQTLRGVRIVSTPARHYSGRALADRNATLWTSWSVVGPSHRVFISGDTGYSDHFKAIGEKFGPFDLSFTKIGAYGPSAHWHDIHMTPEEAVQAQLDLRAKRLFPVHWATFNLAFHDWDEPVRRTLAAAQAKGVQVVTPRIGEIVDVDRAFVSTAWWESVR